MSIRDPGKIIVNSPFSKPDMPWKGNDGKWYRTWEDLRDAENDHILGKGTCKEVTMEDLKSIVNHPSHYQGKKFEVIDIIEDFDLGFNLGNAIKYILRAGKKEIGDAAFVRDLDKAIWYLNREVEKK